MSDLQAPLGNINITPRAIATIAYQAAMQSYGVVGLASKNIFDEVTNVLVKDPSHGIEVTFEAGKIDIDVFIIIEYGTRIKSVAASVANTIRYQVEKTIGIPVNFINVHVQGLRVSSVD